MFYICRDRSLDLSEESGQTLRSVPTETLKTKKVMPIGYQFMNE